MKIGSATIISRPSFSIPFIKPPNMIPNVDEAQMKKELTLKHLGGIKPEAPWIKRYGLGIKFTDEIQEDDFKFSEFNAKLLSSESHLCSIAMHKEASYKQEPEHVEESPPELKVKRVLSEQIMHKTNRSIEESFGLKEYAYAVQEFEQDVDPNKVSIIEDTRIESAYDK